MGFRVWVGAIGFRLEGLVLVFWGLGLGVQGLGLRVEGFGV